MVRLRRHVDEALQRALRGENQLSVALESDAGDQIKGRVAFQVLNDFQQRIFTLAAHNVAILWTKYGGLDPEANFGGADDFTRVDAWTMPQLRRVTASLNVSF